MATDTLFIFGAKSTALEMAELAAELYPQCRRVHVVGDGEETDGDRIITVSQLGTAVKSVDGRCRGILSMADPERRIERLAIMREQGIEPATLVHPSATVSPSARIGEGCYLAAGCRISVNAVVGAHCLINLNATIGHDAVLGEHCVINPGAAISGNVRIGERCLIGANSFVHQGKTIGSDAQVDAMTHVWRDVPAGHVATSRQLRVDRRLGRTEPRRDGDAEGDG